MLGHKRIPSREGGIEVVVEELATRMTAMGHKVTCYNRSGRHVGGKEFSAGREKEYKGVELKQVITVDKKGLAAVTSSFFGAAAVSFGNYDVVHFHAEGPCAMLWLPKLFGKRCVATIHGIDWRRTKWGGFASRYIKLGEKVAAKYADEIVVLSEGVQKYFMDMYGRKTVFIPNGTGRVIPRTLRLIKRHGLDKGGYILFLGRLVPEKGIACLIEAFQNVRTEKKLVIAGGSSDTDSFVKEIKETAKEDGRIIFTGFVQGEMLEELYSNAYLYVLPSNLEGMPLTLLEAMSYGNCCLVSDIEECASVVEGSAPVFERGSVKDLAEKLQFLCDDEEAVLEYRKRIRELIDRKCGWDEVAERTAALYRGKENEGALRRDRRAEDFGGGGHRHDAYAGEQRL